jgi:hypothetical protein
LVWSNSNRSYYMKAESLNNTVKESTTEFINF